MTGRGAVALAAPIAAALGALLATAAHERTAAPDAAPAPAATAPVERRTLVERDQVIGTLGFADPRTVVHLPAVAAPGTVTWLAREGSVVRRGEPLYRVNGHPATLLYGRVPAYRTLRPGARGGDVQQLERNLAALGHAAAGMRVDKRYTAATAAAVRAAGLGRAGAVRRGRVVFLPGRRRVGEHRTAVGALLGLGGEVMRTAAAERVVDIELDADRQTLVERGDRVEVTMPGDRVVVGRIARVGSVARARDGPDSVRPVIDVIVALPAERRMAGLDAAPVTVAIVRRSRSDVLAVPITALLARPGGGFALEPAGVRRRPLAVRVGMTAGGYAEVAGRGLSEGMRVVVAE